MKNGEDEDEFWYKFYIQSFISLIYLFNLTTLFILIRCVLILFLQIKSELLQFHEFNLQSYNLMFKEVSSIDLHQWLIEQQRLS
mgnify:CR=1 FL=1